MAATETNYSTAEHSSRSVPQLLRDFLGEVTALLRDEVSLARGEVTENLSQLSTGLMFVGAGALILLAGLIKLLDAAVVALMPYVPAEALWLAPFIIGGVVALIGIAMLLGGRSKIQPKAVAPTHTIHQSQRDQRMLKERLS